MSYRPTSWNPAVLLLLLGLLPLGGLSACSDPDLNIRKSKLERTAFRQGPSADGAGVAAGTTAWGLAELQRQPMDKNLIFSPYSASLALAMVYQGARGSTQTQMARALHFPSAPEQLGPALGAVDLQVISHANADVALEVANAAWVQRDLPVQSAFLDALAQNYGAGIGLTDFVKNPEGARQDVNAWASGHTQGRIPALFAPGSIDSSVRLVLANAVYFKASWQTPFNPRLTAPAAFHRADGSSVDVPTMTMHGPVGYASGAGFEAIDLPYLHGALSMVVVVPDRGTFSSFAAGLSPAQLSAVISGLNGAILDLTFPKFTASTSLDLASDLQAQGMVDAFSGAADFSGIDGARDLSLQRVVQQAFVDVNESGTEAAAATGATVGIVSVAQTLKVDRPFLYFIRDIPTGELLFIGAVVDPSAR